MASLLKGFTVLFDRFLGYLESKFPDFPEIKEYRTGLHLVDSMSSMGGNYAGRKILAEYLNFTADFYREIYQMDEKFFDDKDLDEEVIIENTVEKQESIGKLNLIKEIWKGKLTDKDKATIWEYFQKLLKIGFMADNTGAYTNHLLWISFHDLLVKYKFTNPYYKRTFKVNNVKTIIDVDLDNYKLTLSKNGKDELVGFQDLQSLEQLIVYVKDGKL